MKKIQQDSDKDVINKSRTQMCVWFIGIKYFRREEVRQERNGNCLLQKINSTDIININSTNMNMI